MYTSMSLCIPVWINVYYSLSDSLGEGVGDGVNLVKNCGEIFMVTWDRWQLDVLNSEGNIVVCSGRQVGKTEIIAFKTATFIHDHPFKKVLLISVTE